MVPQSRLAYEPVAREALYETRLAPLLQHPSRASGSTSKRRGDRAVRVLLIEFGLGLDPVLAWLRGYEEKLSLGVGEREGDRLDGEKA